LKNTIIFVLTLIGAFLNRVKITIHAVETDVINSAISFTGSIILIKVIITILFTFIPTETVMYIDRYFKDNSRLCSKKQGRIGKLLVLLLSSALFPPLIITNSFIFSPCGQFDNEQPQGKPCGIFNIQALF
jgi:hypothetical protein